MKIAKLGHCCLLIEENNLRILTDPGSFSTDQNTEKDIDLILITHEHSDHFHLDSLKTVLANNPQAKIITNAAVGVILKAEGIDHSLVEHGGSQTIGHVLIEGFGDQHADIYETIEVVQNTGYFIADRLFYPGDALYNPGKTVEILALPIVGPWLKTSEAVDYAKLIKPQVCFPVHDGMLNELGAVFHKVSAMILKEQGIELRPLESGAMLEV